MRKHALTGILAIALAAAPGGRPAAAQASFDKVEVKTTPLGHGLYMLAGAGGNIVACTGADGVLLVDAEYAPLHDKIVAALRKVTDKPVRFLVNTHWHPDHTNGNGPFAKEGAVIIAQDNVYARLSSEQFVRHVNRVIPAAPPEARPAVTYDHAATLHFDGQTIRLVHPLRAHTDGDTIVDFPDADVLHMGDCFFAGQYPIVDVGTGGTIDGYIAAVEEGLKLAGEHTKVVPGHGPLATRADLAAFDVMLHAARDAVARLKARGMSLPQVQAAHPTAELDEKWGKGFIKPDMFVEFIYDSLPKEK